MLMIKGIAKVIFKQFKGTLIFLTLSNRHSIALIDFFISVLHNLNKKKYMFEILFTLLKGLNLLFYILFI